MGKSRTLREKCAIEGCDRLGAIQRHCHIHYVTRVYRNVPKVRERLHDVNRTARSRFNRSKHWCLQHGYLWELTLEEFAALLDKGCHYCGADISGETGRGLDRLDTLKAYVHGNVVPCCGRCNRVRGYAFTPEETLVMMRALGEWKKSLLGPNENESK